MFRRLNHVIALATPKPTDDVVCFVSDLDVAYNPLQHILFRMSCVWSAFQFFFCLWPVIGYHCVKVPSFVIVFLRLDRGLRDAIYAHHIVDGIL